MEKEWPHVDPLPLGQFEALSPYRFLQRSHYDWHPTDEQMADARKMLRPLNEDSFVEQMKDTREPIVFTYLRRPNYYAAFASAPKVISEQQRLGLTFVWSPVTGVLLQSQTGGSTTAWGTQSSGTEPLEASGLQATYSKDCTQVQYPLGGGGQKTVIFANDRVQVTVERDGQIVEHVPVFDPATVFSSAEYSMSPAPVEITGPRPAACPDPNVPCGEVVGPVPGKTLFVVELRATGKLVYEIRPTR